MHTGSRRIGYRLAVWASQWPVELFSAPATVAQPQWRPAVDVYEACDALVVRMELAGVSEDDFEVSLYQDALVVEGERQWRVPGEVEHFLAAEIAYGPFRIEVPLPFPVDSTAVRATYEDGFLTLRLPKAEGAP